MHEIGVAEVAPSEETGPRDVADREHGPAGCGPGLTRDHGAGWIWGDPADGIPEDSWGDGFDDTADDIDDYEHSARRHHQ